MVMLLVFGVGLWAILRVGSRLRPARNVAGEWHVQWGEGTRPSLPDQMTVAQSGKFVTATFHAPDESRGIRLQGQLENTPAGLTLRGTRPAVSLTAVLDDAGDRLTGTAEGDATTRWQATRARGR